MSTTKNNLAQAVEVFITGLRPARQTPDFDVVIIGSGYGGAVASSRLARAQIPNSPQGLSVCVLERGREYLPGDFPDSLAKLPGEIRFQGATAKAAQGNAQGLFDLHLNDDINILRANGLGGGSLINASVAERMSPAIWHDEHWPKCLRHEAAQFDQYYLRAEKMLRLVQLPKHEWHSKTRQLQRLGAVIDKKGERSFRPVQLAVKLAAGENPHGIAQSVCVGCGDCFTGCNYNAKNTLTTNYLPDAKRFGAQIYTGATVYHVSRVQQADADADANEPLWQIHFGLSDSPNTNARAQRFSMTARIVILAAGTLGSTEILMRSKEQGLTLSKQLGTRFSGNGDMIWAGFKQNEEVRIGAPEAQPFAQRQVGPTISAMLDLRQHKAHPIVIQDAAIPAVVSL